MSQCSEAPCAAVVGGEIMLFGVRVTVDPMRKSVSMNNLSEYEPVNRGGAPDININEAPKPTAAAYASADDAVPLPTNGNRERKRGVPWTEEEHKLFLIGLQKVGKGDWRGISRNFVKTRTSTQVASHAQKYFIRRGNSLKRRRRRSSLFDITTDSVDPMSIDGCNNHQESPPKELSLSPMGNSTPTQSVLENNSFSLDLNQQVPTEQSLRLSLSSGPDCTTTQMMMPPDSVISVA